MIMHDSHLRPDGTTFPPVTPDPPPPPGYRSPEVGDALPGEEPAATDVPAAAEEAADEESAAQSGERTDEPEAEEPPD